jgi:uncharacterized protein YlxW (UPF0749 family)
VRSAQMFLVLGVLLTAVAAVPVLFAIRPERAAIEGTVSLDPTSLRMLQDGVRASATEVELHIRELESEIQSIKAEHSKAEIEVRLERLSKEVADTRVAPLGVCVYAYAGDKSAKLCAVWRQSKLRFMGYAMASDKSFKYSNLSA